MNLLNINMHFKCNAKCIFCVVGIPEEQCSNQTIIGYEQMLEALKKGIEKGSKELVLSGGEPTIHPKITEVVKEAKRLGYCSIQIKSNGIKLKDFEFVEELADAGVDVFCLSLQGPKAEVHDYVVGVPGAFDSIVQASHHIGRIGKTLITPTCIQKANYKYLPDTIRLMIEMGSKHCCPTFIEPNGSAREHFKNVVPSYTEVLPYLKQAIDVLKTSNIHWNVHGFPMCMVKGYESYSLDLWRSGDSVAGTVIEDYLEYERENFRTKDSKCSVCSLNSLCSGPWANYVKMYGFDEFKPIEAVSVAELIPMDILVKTLFV